MATGVIEFRAALVIKTRNLNVTGPEVQSVHRVTFK